MRATPNSEIDSQKVYDHLGHKIAFVEYGDLDNIAIECETCNEVLADWDIEGK